MLHPPAHFLRRIPLTATLLAATLLGLVSCADPANSPSSLQPDAPMTAVVSVAPLQEVVRRVLPEGSTVSVLIPPGSSPHTYAPLPSDAARLSRADLVVTVGMGLEGASEPALHRMPAGKRVEFASVIDPAFTAGHDHADPAGHDHTICAHATDPHLWLDAGAMAELARAIGAHLAERGDASAPRRADAVITDIRAADARAKAALVPVRGGRLITQHDAWRRFAARYGLEILGSVLPVGSGEPTPGDMQRAIDAVNHARAQSGAPIAIMTEPQLNPRPAERIASELGLPMGVLDPLGSGDWFSLLEHNTRVMLDALAAPEPPR